MLPSIVWMWFVALAWPQSPMRIAPVEFDGPTPTIGEWVPVDELFDSELFGVYFVRPQSILVDLSVARWLHVGEARAQEPLLVMHRSTIDMVAAGTEASDSELPLFVFEEDVLPGTQADGRSHTTCSAYACAPSTLDSALFAKARRDGTVGWVDITLTEARELLTRKAALRRLLRVFPRPERAALTAMEPSTLQESMAVLLVLLRASEASEAERHRAGRFDVDCRLGSSDTCTAYGRELLLRNHDDEAGKVLAYACKRGSSVACGPREDIVRDPTLDRLSSGEPVSEEPPETLPDGFDQAWWPSGALWTVAYRPVDQLPDPELRLLPEYPPEPTAGATCFVLARVGMDGVPLEVRVKGCRDPYALAARTALEQWRWPILPRSVSTIVKVPFHPGG